MIHLDESMRKSMNITYSGMLATRRDIEPLPNIPTAEQIRRLETEMLQMEQLPIETIHHFAPGQYAREIVIPAGTLLTGKTHRTEHLNVVSKGDITVWTECGMKRIKAPFTFVSKPGTKRVGLAHEETVWITIHATSETDLVKLEAGDFISTSCSAGSSLVMRISGREIT